jgi:hypothetical protein
MAYLLDANVFIEAKNRHYGFDFCPAFWDWIIQSHTAGTVFSVQRVEAELVGRGDDLSTWTRQRGDSFFLRPDNALPASLQTVSAWVSTQQYDPGAVATYLQNTDYYLVAYAHAHGHVVVTHEKSAPMSTKTIKIPDVCMGINTAYVTPFEMLRQEHARFVL